MISFNIYIIGAGGQGTGLISEIILRAADHAGYDVKGVDTHGLAQRGGIVVSQVRIGVGNYSPLIPSGEADLVVALERHEALRGMNTALKDGGTLIFYNTVWQPLAVRLGQEKEVGAEIISEQCRTRNITEIKVEDHTLPDVRMQNIALLAEIDKKQLIPSVMTDHYKEAMNDLMTGDMLKKNMQLFDKCRSADKGL